MLLPPKFHKGNLTLEKLQKECESIQDHEIAKLVHLQGAIVEVPVNEENNFNQAQYFTLDDIMKVPELKFIEVEDETKIPSMIANELENKLLLIFNEVLFIEDKETRVLGFGKV
jgi:hypothetical protein